MSYPEGHIERFASARHIANEASGTSATDQVSLQLGGKVHMTLECYEAMASAINSLLDGKDKLARHITGFSSMFEQNKRELMAHGWDACTEKVGFITSGLAPKMVEDLKADNPFRKPIDIPGVTE